MTTKSTRNSVLLNCSFAALAVVALTACNPSKQQGVQAPPVAKVVVAQPQVITVTNWDEYPGHLEAVEMVEIKPRVSGYLESVHFQDGAEVKAGDLLFVIDPKPYQAELERAQADRQAMEIRLELAKNDLKRAETLRSTRAISDEEYDSRSKAARQADSALAAAKASVTMAQINVDYTQIKSPISGRIGRRIVTPGNLVQGNTGTSLATVVSMIPIYCYFDVNESAFLKYRQNSGEAGNAMLCEMTLSGGTDYAQKGKVDFFDNQVDEKTGTIRMRAVFSNEDRALVPGLFANVRVPAGPAVENLFIPDITVNSDQGNKFVLVVGKSNTVEVRPVQIGRANGALRAILGGLTADDRVIVNGQLMMMPRPGMPVEIITAPAPASAASSPAPAKEQAKN